MKIKYLGVADVREIGKGENFGGRLSEPLKTKLVWDWDNNHVIDTSAEEYSDVSSETWELILEEENFKDVSDLKKLPLSQAEKMWQGKKDTPVGVAPGGVAGDAVTPSPSTSTEAGGPTPGGGPKTTAGGST